MRLVLALGGNALLPPGEDPTYEKQAENIGQTARSIAELAEQGHDLVVVHGNGPQVGNIILQEENTPPKMPLDVEVAETQGQIGYLLQREIRKAYRERGLEQDAITVVTQVVVDPKSEAFDQPWKPVGPFYSGEEAKEKKGFIREVGNGEKPFRRVVPSPEPLEVVESEQVQRLVEDGCTAIACGGGGIPVTGSLDGVEAVVDKDRSAALLAHEIDADRLLILTDVEYAYRDFGEEEREAIRSLTPAEAKELAEQGVFGEGSMRPKVEAAASFAEETGNRAVIGGIDDMLKVFEGEGTVVEEE